MPGETPLAASRHAAYTGLRMICPWPLSPIISALDSLLQIKNLLYNICKMWSVIFKQFQNFDVILENPAYGGAKCVFLDKSIPYILFIDCFEIVQKARKVFSADADM